MLGFKRILHKRKATPEPETAKLEKDEENTSTIEESPCEENTHNQTAIEDSVDQPVDYNCIASDFTDDMLAMEMMRLGYDPANRDKQQMIEILYTHMDSNKPTVEVDSAQV